jgi:hypothetical protein
LAIENFEPRSSATLFFVAAKLGLFGRDTVFICNDYAITRIGALASGDVLVFDLNLISCWPRYPVLLTTQLRKYARPRTLPTVHTAE